MKSVLLSRTAFGGFCIALIGFAACATTDGMRRDLEDCQRGIQSACDKVEEKCNDLLNPHRDDPSDKKQAPGDLDAGFGAAANFSGASDYDESSALANGPTLLDLAVMAGENQVDAVAKVSKEDACEVCAICGEAGVELPADCSKCSASA